MQQETTVEVDEGSRGIGVVISQIDDGGFHVEASNELRKVVTELHAQAKNYEAKAKGALTMTLAIEVDPTGVVIVKPQVTSKIPKPRRGAQAFFVTKGGNLSVENPRQPRLPIREVTMPAVDARDAAKPQQAVRTI